MRRSKPLALLAVLLLLQGTATAFGYVEGRTNTDATPGDTVVFAGYLFGANGSARLVSINAPDTWEVAVAPEEVHFPVTSPDRVLQTEGGYRNLRAVTVRSTIPATADPGTYHVTATVRQHAAGAEGSLTVRQEHTFRYTITVSGQETSATPRVSEEGSGEERTNATGATRKDATTNTTTRPATNPDGASEGVEGELIIGVLLFEAAWIIAMWRVLR